MNLSLSLSNDRVHGFHDRNINPTIELFYRPYGLCEKINHAKPCGDMVLGNFSREVRFSD